MPRSKAGSSERTREKAEVEKENEEVRRMPEEDPKRERELERKIDLMSNGKTQSGKTRVEKW